MTEQNKLKMKTEELKIKPSVCIPWEEKLKELLSLLDQSIILLCTEGTELTWFTQWTDIAQDLVSMAFIKS